jgi:hypothetical protein
MHVVWGRREEGGQRPEGLTLVINMHVFLRLIISKVSKRRGDSPLCSTSSQSYRVSSSVKIEEYTKCCYVRR